MTNYVGYAFLVAGLALFLLSLIGEPRKSMPLKFTAVMLVMAGLALLQFGGLDG